LDRALVPEPSRAQHVVDSILALGASFIKLRTYENTQTYWAIAAATRRRGVPLYGHPPWGVDEIAVADSGQQSVEHGYFPWRLDSMPAARRKAVLEAFRDHRVAQLPTQVTWGVRRIHPDSLRILVDGPAAMAHPWRSALSPSLLGFWRRETDRLARIANERPLTPERLREWNDNLDGMAHDIALLRQAGVPVFAGSDLAVARYPGEGVHEELEILVAKGVMTSADALHSATSGAAQFMGMADSLGTIERGMIADLVVLDGDPAADIRNVRRVRAVVQGGRFIDRAALERAVQGQR
jgi:hypothetical protein